MASFYRHILFRGLLIQKEVKMIKVKKDNKVILIKESQLPRYRSLGYQEVQKKEYKVEKNDKKDVSSQGNAD